MPTAHNVEYVKKLISGSPVFIASKTWCSFSKSAKATISQYPVQANIIELDNRGE
jgi:hypothetical protein